MRPELEKYNETRTTFTAVFVRYGLKSSYRGYPKKTLLFRDIKSIDGKIKTDHVWFTITQGFEALGEIAPDTVIKFDARVKPYTKGYVNYRELIDERTTDYRLSHPTKIEIQKATQ